MKKTICGAFALLSSLAVLLSCNQDETPFGPQDNDAFPSSVTGKVTDRKGKALSGALVTVLPGGVTTVSGPDGSFTLSGLASGKYRVALAKDDYRDTMWLDSVRLGMKETHSVGAMGMRYRYATVNGVVEDANGAAQTMAGIAVENQTSTALAVDGRFVLGRVEPGRVRLFSAVQGLGYATLDTVLQADETLEGVKMRIDRRGGAVTGKVVDANKNPVVGASVKAVGGVLSTSTGSDGTFRITEIPGEGNVVVEISKGDLSAMISGVRVGEGEQTSLDSIRIGAPSAAVGVVSVRPGLAMGYVTDSVITLVADTVSGDTSFHVVRYLWKLDDGTVWDTTSVNVLVVGRARFGTQAGSHAVLVKVVAIDGRVTNPGTLTVRLEAPPVVKRVRPLADTTRRWFDSVYTVAWDVTDDNLDSVLIAGVRVKSSTSRYERALTLPVGPATIRIKAKDVSGYVTWDSVRVTRLPFDTSKPSITLQNLSREATIPFDQSSTTVSWSVKDASGLDSVWVDSVRVYPDSSGKVSKTLTVEQGSTRIVRIVAWDRSGLVNRDSVKLTRPSTADTGSYGIPWNPAVSYGVLIDSRDGKQYRTVDIGSQTWMAENLNYAGSGTTGACFNESNDSCAKYGRRYAWSEMMAATPKYDSLLLNASLQHRGICPEGWHVPSKAEWDALVVAVGGISTAGSALRSSKGWYSGNGTDAYGFRLLPESGILFDSALIDTVKYAMIWSASEDEGLNAWGLGILGNSAALDYYAFDKVNTLPLRCSRNTVDPSISLQALLVDSAFVLDAYDSTKTTLTHSVASTVKRIAVRATTRSPSATLKINGVDAVSGVATMVDVPNDTSITILVSNPDNPSTKTYTLQIVHAAAVPSDTTLMYLSINGDTLSPPFASDTLVYADTVASSDTSVTVYANATDTSAEVWINGVQGHWRFVNLNSAGTITQIRVVVHSTTDTDSLAYTVNVYRRPTPAIDTTWGIPWQTGDITYGVLHDVRDDQEYRTVVIGSQTWMAENLNYKGSGADTVGVCYDNNADSCAKYGRLYRWSEAMDTTSTYDSIMLGASLPHRGICPEGWRVPSDAEWDTLKATVGWTDTAVGAKLKSTSGWLGSANGTDNVGFRALPAGNNYTTGGFILSGYYAGWWSSSESSDVMAWLRNIYDSNALGRYYDDKPIGLSVRCLKN